jgi:hypothetical protein
LHKIAVRGDKSALSAHGLEGKEIHGDISRTCWNDVSISPRYKDAPQSARLQHRPTSSTLTLCNAMQLQIQLQSQPHRRFDSHAPEAAYFISVTSFLKFPLFRLVSSNSRSRPFSSTKWSRRCGPVTLHHPTSPEELIYAHSLDHLLLCQCSEFFNLGRLC